MASTIDTKVVEMQFKNDDFEKNVAESQKTLEKLKKDLDFESTGRTATAAFKSVGSAVNSVNFDRLYSSIETINSKLSAVGVATATAVSNLTTKVGSEVKGFYDKTLGQIISGGSARALKIATGKFKLQGVISDAEEIQKVSDAIGASVKGTAYGLDAAYAAGSQMVASGLRDTEKLTQALTGAAGVATMTSTSFEWVGGLFAQVQAAGAVTNDVLTRLTEQGLPAKDVLAEALGKSSSEIFDMASKKEISSQTFFDVMYKKYGEFAKKANDTYTGALSNMNAALSRIGADFFTPYYENMRQAINATTTFIDTFKTLITELGVYKALEKIMVKIRKQYIENINNLTKAFIKTDSKTGSTLTKTGKRLMSGIKTITSGIKNVLRFIGKIPELGYNIKSSFDDIGIKRAVEIFKELAQYLTINHRIGISIRRVFGAMFATFKSGLNIVSVLISVLAGLADTIGRVLAPFIESAIILLGAAARIISSCQRKITEFLSAIDFSPFKELADDIKTFAGSLSDMPSTLYKNVRAFLKWWSSFNKIQKIDSVKKVIESINFAIRTLVDTIKMVRDSGANFLQQVFGNAPQILQPISDFFNSFGDATNDLISNDSIGFIDGLSSSIQDMASKFQNFGSSVSNTITENIEPFKKRFDVIFENVRNVVQNLVDIFSSGTEQIKGINWQSAFKSFESIGEFLAGLASGAFGTAAKAVLDILGKLTEGLNGFVTGVSNAQNKISNALTPVGEKVTETGDGLLSGISGFISKLSPVGVAYADTLEPVAENTKTFGDSMAETLGNLKTFFSNAAKAIGDAFKTITENIDWTDVLITVNTLSTALLAWDTHKIAKGFGGLSKDLTDVTKNIASTFKNIADVPKKVSDVLTTVKDNLTSMQKEINPNKILSIGASLLMIAGALVILSGIPTESLERSLAALAGTFAVMVVAIIGLAKIAASDKFNVAGLGKVSLLMLSISGAVLVVSTALKKLSTIKEEDLVRSVITLVVIIGALTALASKASKVNPEALTGISVLLLSTAISMSIISKVVETFAKMDLASLSKGVAGLGAVLITLGVFLAIVTNLDKVFALLTTNPFSKPIQVYQQPAEQMKVNLMEMAGALLIISAAMIIIAKAVDIFAKIKNFKQGLTGFIVTLGIVAVALGGLQKITEVTSVNPSVYLAIAGAILILASAMNAIAVSVLIFGTMDTGTLTQGLMAFATTLTIVSVALGVLGGLVGSGNLLAAAGAIAILAAAMGLLIPIIITMGALPWDTFVAGLLKFGVAIAALVAVGVIFSHFAVQLETAAAIIMSFSAAITLLGIGLVFIGAGLLAISVAGIGAAAAIQMLVLAIGNTLPILATDLALAITAFITTLGKMAPKISEALKEIIVGVIGGVISAATEIVGQLQPLVDALLNFIVENAPKAAEALLQLILSGITALSNHMDELVGGLVDLIKSLLTAIVNHIPDFVDALTEFVSGVFGKIGEIIEDMDLQDLIDTFTGAFTKIFDAITDGISGIIDSIGDVFGNIANVIWAIKDLVVVLGDQGIMTAVSNAGKLVSIGTSIADFAVKVADHADTLQKTGEGVKNLTDGLMSLKQIDTSTGTAFTSISRGLKSLKANSTKLSEAADNIKKFSDILKDGVADTISNVRDAFDSFATSVGDLSYKLWDLNNNASSANDSIGNIGTSLSSISSSSDIDTSKYTNAFNNISTEASNTADSMTTTGNAIGDNLVKGLNDRESSAYSAGSSLISEVKSGIEDSNFGFYHLGQDAGQGYIDGINSKTFASHRAGSNLANEAEKGTKKTQESNSPAKKFIKLGTYAGEGYIIGIGSYEKASNRAGGSLAKSAMSAMAETISEIKYAFNNDLDYSPTITPVVDMNNVNSSFRQMNGMFSMMMTGVSGSPTLTTKNAQIVNANLSAQLQNGTTNSDVVAALNNLRSELISRPQVVNNNSVNGITYDDGSNIASAIGAIVNGVELQTRAGVR